MPDWSWILVVVGVLTLAVVVARVVIALSPSAGVRAGSTVASSPAGTDDTETSPGKDASGA